MKITVLFLLFTLSAFAQSPGSGQADFERTCAVCHGADAAGGEFGPNIVARLTRLTDAELTTTIRAGLPSRGMPASALSDDQLTRLVTYVRSLRNGRRIPETRTVDLVSGGQLQGTVINESFVDLQLRTADQQVHLLRTAKGKYREVTSQTDWTSYDGDVRGNRYSRLTEIDSKNAKNLAAQWAFSFENVPRLETTPVVVEGIMYVTSGNECYALDAGTGRTIWHFQRQRTKNLIGNASQGFNRGVSQAGNRVFMATDNAHLIALNRFTGELVWESEMADWRQNYAATSAPLAAGRFVIAGTGGGEQGVRGFIAAYDQETGKEAWRFWTVPKRGEPGSETWQGTGIDHGGGASWFTGNYEPETETVYWTTGNPGPDYNDAQRGGDNLYTCSILALDLKTGKLKWHYQTTPHDVFDWDATEPLILVDREWEGKPRKLLVQANRNGFLYVLDRTTGKLLSGKPFVDKLTWASGMAADGRPIKKELPKVGNGTQVCPAQTGATNWFSNSFNPVTGLYYVQTLEKCGIFSVAPVEWEAGKAYLGGGQRSVPGERPRKILRALDIETGKSIWQFEQAGLGNTSGGVLSTASGVVFFCDDSGMLVALDGRSGELLWQFQTNQIFKASPMTYQFDGRQYVAIAAGVNILSFALPR